MSEALLRRALGWPMLMVKKRHLSRFVRNLQDSRLQGERYLRQYLKMTAGSDFARDHGLNESMSVEQFRAALAVAGFERMEPYVSRCTEGNTQALFHPTTALLMFAVTSGSTAPAKHIPVTAVSLAEYRQSWSIWAVKVALDYPQIPYGGVVSLTSTWQSGMTPSGVPIGSITGFVHQAMHGILRFTNAVPPQVALAQNYENRYYLTLLCALRRRDIRMITTANPSTLLQVGRFLTEWREDLTRDLRDGTISRGQSDAQRLSPVMRWWLGIKATKRARELEQLPSGHFLPRNLWPHLQLLGVWTGGTLQNYLTQLPAYYGDLPLRDHGLSASEARITIPLADNTASGPLNTAGGFFEFIPAENYDKADRQTLLPHELTVSASYYVVMTTSGGLARYDLVDLVRCTGFIGTTPMLEFLNKGSQFANLTGEKLAAVQVSQALRALTERFQLGECMLVPMAGDPAGYTLFLEAGRDFDQLALALDEMLCAANIEYGEKRRTQRLRPVRVQQARPGSFRRLKMEHLQRRGGTPEQYKHPCLVATEAAAREAGLDLE